MKTTSEVNRTLDKTLMTLTSACIHAALMVGVCCAAATTEKKPLAVPTKLIELKTVKAALPPPPKKETPKPEPPKPEQPKPPKPEPPKPEPPKPEPPKPEPPKPVEVKPPAPTPAVVKTETPKPEAKPVKKLTRREEMLERLKNAEVKKTKPAPQRQQTTYTPPKPVQPVATKSAADYRQKFMGKVSKAQDMNFFAAAGQTITEAEENYAEAYVKPVLYEMWQPSRAGMKYANPSPVVISFTVMPNGSIANMRITSKSNEPVMNRSVEELIRMPIQLASFAEAGVKQSFLKISVTLRLEDK